MRGDVVCLQSTACAGAWYDGEMEVLYGLHPVEEAVRAGGRRLEYVLVSRERSAKLEQLMELCRASGVRCSLVSKDEITRIARTDAHQGTVAAMRERQFLALEDLLRARGRFTRRFFLALDGVEDPHNLGALLRSADGAGVDGVVLPERRSAPITGVVAKTSAGASEHVAIARVTNMTRALEQMKKENVWIVGLDERGTESYSDFDWNLDACLVLGAEGAGLHDLVKKTCDHLLRIPMMGSVSSLNVSVAGAVVMYEALRQKIGPAATTAAPLKAAKPKKGLGS